jgi:hypothetical protein
MLCIETLALKDPTDHAPYVSLDLSVN